MKYASMNVNTGMLFSNMVMYSPIFATGATLFKAGQTDVKSASDAAQALRPIAGDCAYILLALGLIGTGFLAVPILTSSAAYAVSEVFGWRLGLDRNPSHANSLRGNYCCHVGGHVHQFRWDQSN